MLAADDDVCACWLVRDRTLSIGEVAATGNGADSKATPPSIEADVADGRLATVADSGPTPPSIGTGAAVVGNSSAARAGSAPTPPSFEDDATAAGAAA